MDHLLAHGSPMREMGDSQISLDARNYLSLAALILLALDYLWLLKDEIKYIWRPPFRPSQALYMVSRYLPLSMQIVNYVLVHKFLLAGPVSTSNCRIWFSLLGGVCTVTVIVLDAILLLRIYALYMKNTKMFLLAIPLLAEQVIAQALLGNSVFDDHPFTSRCDLFRTPKIAAPLGVLTLISHVGLWGAIWVKRNVSEAAVLSLVVRESHWSLAVFIVPTAVMIPYSFHIRVADPFIIFVWPITLFSITACRIVLNMHKLKTESPHDRTVSTTDFLFSTILASTRSSHELNFLQSTPAVELAAKEDQK